MTVHPSRACSHSSHCFYDKREVVKSDEDDVEFLKSQEDAVEAFESAEEPLDLVAFLVQGGSYSHGSIRLEFEGTTGTIPGSSTSWRVSSPA